VVVRAMSRRNWNLKQYWCAVRLKLRVVLQKRAVKQMMRKAALEPGWSGYL
jgi:hypothetical protein